MDSRIGNNRTMGIKVILAKLIRERGYRAMRHILLIGLIFFLIYRGFYYDYDFRPGFNIHTLLNSILVFLLWGACCINIYILIPRYLFRNKIADYINFFSLSILPALFTGLAIGYYYECWYVPEYRTIFTFKQLAIAILTSTIAVILYLIAFSVFPILQRLFVHDQQLKTVEKKQITSELKLLKEQTQPQFLSGILEKCQLLVTEGNTADASRVLHQLSKVLRYQLYDTRRETVLLSADMNFLKEYMILEKMVGSGFCFILHTRGELNKVMVSPLLFIPIVTRVISYLREKEGQEPNKIVLDINYQEPTITFSCCFSLLPQKTFQWEANELYRRLELLYPGRYLLDCSSRNGQNKITLQLYS